MCFKQMWSQIFGAKSMEAQRAFITLAFEQLEQAE